MAAKLNMFLLLCLSVFLWLSVADALKCYHCKTNNNCDKNEDWESKECAEGGGGGPEPVTTKPTAAPFRKRRAADSVCFVIKNGDKYERGCGIKDHCKGKKDCTECNKDNCNTASNLKMSPFVLMLILSFTGIPKILY